MARAMYAGRVFLDPQIEQLLFCPYRKVDAQHGLHGKGGSPSGLGRAVWFNKRHQITPRHHQRHLFQKLTLARARGLLLETSTQAPLLHERIIAWARGLRSFAEFP